MGRAVKVPDANVHHLIRQAYHAGGQYQWAREALVNAIQAKATWVNFGVDEQSYRLHGVERRYVADNGLGMNEDNLQIFLSSFGGGGRTIGDTENFGQGFKSSCYEWNEYGIIVMSWTEETPEGRMIWIHFNSTRGQWELKDFDVYYEGSDLDGEPDDINDCIPPTYNRELLINLDEFHLPEIKEAGHGTVFLFLGDRKDRNTAKGDYKRGEDSSNRGIVGYLNTRFVSIPADVHVRVSSLESKAEDSERRDTKDNVIVGPDGKRRTIHSRVVKGLKQFISQEHQTGKLHLKHGTTLEWYLTKNDDVGRSGGYGPTAPVIAVQYENEAYDVRTTKQQYRPFGITDNLRNRVWLFITPPVISPDEPSKWGVIPQASRGMLIGKGGTELPWSDWQDNFYNQLPGPIRAALDDTMTGQSSTSEADRKERLKRTIERLSTRFRPMMLMKDETGRESGNPSSSTGKSRVGTGKSPSGERKGSSPRNPSKDAGGTGDKVVLNRNEAGEFSGSERRRSDGTPAVVWDKTFSAEEMQHAARFDDKETRDGSFGTLHFNLAFPMFRSEFRYWENEYPRASPDDVAELVKVMYEDEIVSKIMHAHKLKRQELGTDEQGKIARVNDEVLESWISPAALTAAALGLVNVEQRIRVNGGPRFGGSRTKTPLRKKSPLGLK